ncbi:MAG TPA: rhodoquinone biosynthesis methyltransferase RquA [Ramlibacter sp.]|nr:rhodoquinone biosynthesis methyltransferase RquA [Ramlibacter sp.]
MHPSAIADAGLAVPAPASSRTLPIPKYLQQVYWWAYVHPNAVHLFEREWLVNLILFGHYGRLRDAALAELGQTVTGQTLQVARVSGNLTPRLARRLASDASLDVVDMFPVRLKKLAARLPPDDRIVLLRGDSSSLACPDACYDQVLLFFPLHEQPQSARRATLAEAMRVVRPGGKIVIVDYHLPARWHPLRLLMTRLFRKLEPYAMDLWENEVEALQPTGLRPAAITKQTYCGGLYQKLVLIR